MMSYLQALFDLPSNVIEIFRKLESIKNKILKNKWSLVFNNTCIKENLLPNYTRM